MATRLSTRLVVNATSTYVRLAANFVIGIFFTWYVIGQTGLGGFGMMALASGGLGVAFLLETAIDLSLTRALARTLATGSSGASSSREASSSGRVDRVLVSGLAFCAPVAGAILVVFAAIATAAWAGLFNTPADEPALATALAALFLAEGVVAAFSHLVMPYTRAIFAAQRVAVDNMALLGRRLAAPVAAVLAFGVLRPDADLPTRLFLYAGLHAALGVGGATLNLLLARRLVPGLRFARDAFDRATFRELGGAVWQTVQFTMFTNLTPQLISLVINLMFGVVYNGVWQVVLQVGGHVRLVAEGVLRGVDAMATHLGEDGKSAQIVNLMLQGMRYQLAIALPFAAAYMILLGPILELWIGGRLVADERLAAAGLDVAAALGLVAFMASVNMLSELARASTRGVERMLYGLGHVRAYARFAKWAALLVLIGAGTAMAIADSPRPAPIPLAIVYFLYFDVLILWVAARYGDLPVAEAIRQAVPRPLVVTVLLAAAVLFLRRQWPVLTPTRAVLAAAGLGALHLLLVYAVALRGAERRRLLQMLSRVFR